MMASVPFLSMKLIFNFILLLIYTHSTFAQTKLNQFKVSDLKNNTFLLQDSLNLNEANYIIFRGAKECIHCYTDLSHFFETQNKKQNIYFIFENNESDLFRKKQQIYEINQHFSYPHKNYFETQEYSVFKLFNIEITPCIMMIHNEKTTYLPYFELFTNKGFLRTDKLH